MKWITFWDYEPLDYDGSVNLFFSKDISEINEAAKLGIFNMLRLDEVFTYHIKHKGREGRALRKDYLQAWKTCADLVKPLVANNSLQGFSIGDELIWQGLSLDDLQKIASAVKKTFPDIIVYYNDARKPITHKENLFGDRIEFDKFPKTIDWVSFDYYASEAELVRDWYEKHLYPMMWPHQRAFVVPGSFNKMLGDKIFERKIMKRT